MGKRAHKSHVHEDDEFEVRKWEVNASMALHLLTSVHDNRFSEDRT